MKLKLWIFALLLNAIACADEATVPAASEEAELPADQTVTGLRHFMTSQGVRKALLLADSAYVREGGRRFDLVAVDVEFYDPAGRAAGDLTSETGEYVISGGSFVARGDVVLITEGPEGPRRLETDELHYDPNNDELWSDVPFVFREAGRETRGISFRSDADFRNFTVEGAQGQLPGEAIVF